MTPPRRALDFYAEAEAMTAPGRHAAHFRELPRDAAALARVVQGLVVHEFLARAYGVAVPESRRGESHIRPLERMLDALLAQDSRPLSAARPPGKRLVGVCRHFEVLFVGALRANGIPARARRGFGAYFEPGCFTDHEVTEVWNAGESRWVRVDPQLDDVQRKTLGVTFDPLELPADQFLTASEAWMRCRSGTADPDKFGILDMRGLWFIAGNLVRDVAWLNKREMLPWDVWGAMPPPEASLDDEQLAFFDGLAALTDSPDAAFDQLRSVYEDDERVRVPAIVHNALRHRDERV